MVEEIGLGVVDSDGEYVELDGDGYARARLVDGFAHFPAATTNWGIVRAVLTVRDGVPVGWHAFFPPLLVRAGDRVVYDAAEDRLVAHPRAETPTATGPTLTARRYDPIVRG